MFDMMTYDDSGRPRFSVTIENLTPTLAVFTAFNAIFPATNYATKDIRNVYPVLDFDASTNESTIFIGLMPQQYRGGNIEARLFFSMTTATSGDVDWSIQFERISSSDQDIDSDSYSSATSIVDVAVPSTSGVVTVSSITVTSGANMDNVVAGDMFAIQITRGASDDTASGDAELLGVELRGT